MAKKFVYMKESGDGKGVKGAKFYSLDELKDALRGLLSDLSDEEFEAHIKEHVKEVDE